MDSAPTKPLTKHQAAEVVKQHLTTYYGDTLVKTLHLREDPYEKTYENAVYVVAVLDLPNSAKEIEATTGIALTSTDSIDGRYWVVVYPLTVNEYEQTHGYVGLAAREEGVEL